MADAIIRLKSGNELIVKDLQIIRIVDFHNESSTEVKEFESFFIPTDRSLIFTGTSVATMFSNDIESVKIDLIDLTD